MVQRILSFDGGGIRGRWTTSILKRLDEALPGWSQQADLFAGASVGALLAVGLAIGYRPEQLDAIFQKHGPLLFERARPKIVRWLYHAFRSRYNSDPIDDLLEELCGDVRLGELSKWVVIPTVNLDNEIDEPSQRKWEPRIFHNLGNHENGYQQITARQVILYTTATPTLFPSREGYVDGGIAANNPSMIALAQLKEVNTRLSDQSQNHEQVLLSIGTGCVQRYIKNKRLDWGYIQWMRRITDLMNSSSIQLVDRQCRQFLGERYHRLCPSLCEDIAADDGEKTELLAEMAEAADLSQTIAWLKKYWLGKPTRQIEKPKHARHST